MTLLVIELFCWLLSLYGFIRFVRYLAPLGDPEGKPKGDGHGQ